MKSNQWNSHGIAALYIDAIEDLIWMHNFFFCGTEYAPFPIYPTEFDRKKHVYERIDKSISLSQPNFIWSHLENSSAEERFHTVINAKTNPPKVMRSTK